MNNLLKSVTENLIYVLEFAAVIISMFIMAYILEKIAKKRKKDNERILTTRKMTITGMFSAIAAVLHLFDFPLFFAPFFYRLDFSELPILIGTFAFGPVAGVMMEFLKILLKLFIKGTSTAFVGDLANFVIGCSFIIPASAIYSFTKTKKGAVASCIAGTLILTVFGTAFNALYLIPAFSKLFGMPLDSIISMGQKVNSLVTDDSLVSLVICCVAPMNLIKGCFSSIVTLLIYKPLSPILKSGIKNNK